jgi:DNA-binding MarR family transcriptional regulator
VSQAKVTARQFARRYGEVFALFHRALPKRTPLTPESLGVLEHLHLSGPLTITEAARHMDRAQSVMSEIILRLEGKKLLCRIRDQRDHRRVLVWLTPLGEKALEQEAEILNRDRLEQAFTYMPDADSRMLLEKLEQLLRLGTRLPQNKGEAP